MQAPISAGPVSTGLSAILPRKEADATAKRIPAGGEDCLEDYPGEFEGEPQQAAVKPAPPIMRGRLKAKAAFWHTFVRSSLVLSWILHGFPLMWKDGPPPPMHLANHRSALDNAPFVDVAVAELVATDAARVAVTFCLGH